jgi:GH24 family phage-related lysozyme (muramidase)
MNAIDLIKRYEGFRPQAYQDSVGVWTIGYGTTRINGQPVKEGMTITEDQALQLVQQEVNKLWSQIEQITKVSLNENQMNALVDFAYNLGFNSLKNSTLMRLVNESKFEEAANQFPRWVYAGGKVLPGLVKRREAERQLFLS